MPTITVSNAILRELKREAGLLKEKLGGQLSMDDVVRSLLSTRRLNPSDFQGAWKMSDEEAEELARSLRELWSHWKHRTRPKLRGSSAAVQVRAMRRKRFESIGASGKEGVKEKEEGKVAEALRMIQEGRWTVRRAAKFAGLTYHEILNRMAEAEVDSGPNLGDLRKAGPGWLRKEKRRSIAKALTVSNVEKLDVDYDEEADVLYISFGPPVAASDSAVLASDIILRYKGRKVVGITVPSFRKRLK